MALQYQKKPLSPKVTQWGWGLALIGAILILVGFISEINPHDNHADHGTAHAAAAEKAGHDAGGDHGDGHGAAAHGDGHGDGHHGHTQPKLWWFHYLVMFMFILSIALGSMFWIDIEFLMNANWCTPIRRVTEFFASNIWLVAVLILPLLFGGGMDNVFFHWIPLPAGDAVLEGKKAWLNVDRFVITQLIMIALWLFFYKYFINNSRKQDETGDQLLTHKNVKMSPKYIVIFAATLTVAAVDWMMSLNPHWFSTMWGIYYFAGSLVASMSAILLAAILLFEKGYLHPRMNKDSFYSASTFLFSFNCFWAYVAFSQFMLIWYANMPEETQFYFPRWTDTWQPWTYILILVHFLVPVFVLVPRRAKTNLPILKFMCVWLLVAHFLDLYWIVLPAFEGPAATLGDWIMHAGFPIFTVGAIILMFAHRAKKYNLVPIKDPRLELGLGFHLTTVDHNHDNK